ncbi:MAG: hypothetical protein Q9195_007218 [Heterodermia aff. obscurata]
MFTLQLSLFCPTTSWKYTGIGLLVIQLVLAGCYLPNGADRNAQLPKGDDWYQPTGFGPTVDNFSMCCATRRTNQDTVKKDGLCESRPEYHVWRESCSDPSWESPNCIKLCINGTGAVPSSPSSLRSLIAFSTDSSGNARKATDQIVTPCSDQSYCCGINNTTCCDKGDGVWIRNGLPTKIPPNSADTSSPPGSKGLGGGAIAGIVMGAVLGLALLGLAFWFLAKKKRQGTTAGGDGYAEAPVDERDGVPIGASSELQDTALVAELEPAGAHMELAGNYPRWELE